MLQYQILQKTLTLKGGEKNAVLSERKRPGFGGVCSDPCFGRYRCYRSPHAAWLDHRQCVQHPQFQSFKRQVLSQYPVIYAAQSFSTGLLSLR